MAFDAFIQIADIPGEALDKKYRTTAGAGALACGVIGGAVGGRGGGQLGQSKGEQFGEIIYGKMIND